MIDPYLLEVAEKFWSDAGEVTKWPCDIEGAAVLSLPLSIVILSPLSIDGIESWLLKRAVNYKLPCNDRALYGCLIVFKNCGFIFIDGTSDTSERRFSLAHEVAHYLLDYYLPRKRAIEYFGLSITEVLDGVRQASHTERLNGVLSNMTIGPHYHLLEKVGDGSFLRSEVMRAEIQADKLALELLAPFNTVCAHVFEKASVMNYIECRKLTKQLLSDKFGLPKKIIFDYSKLIARYLCPKRSVLDVMGLE